LGAGHPAPKDPIAEDSPDAEWSERHMRDVGRRLALNDVRASDMGILLWVKSIQHDTSVIAGDVEKVRLKDTR